MNRDVEHSCPHIDTILRILSKDNLTKVDKSDIKLLLERIRTINFELRNFL